MKGRFVFDPEVLKLHFGLEEILRELPIKAVSDFHEKGEDDHIHELNEDTLVYYVGDYEFPEEGGIPVLGISPRNHPELGDIVIYERDPSSNLKDQLKFAWSTSGSLGVEFKGKIFALSYENNLPRLTG